MYTSFQIKNFRCFDHLKLDNLAQVNLIAGKNNVGKTAFLEAIFIYCGVYNPELALRLNVFRGVQNMRVQLAKWASTPWDSIFSQFDIDKEIMISAEKDEKHERTLRINTINDPEELQKLRLAIQQDVSIETSTSSASEPIKVLKLEYMNNGKKGVAHAIMDSQNINSEVVPSPEFDFIILPPRFRPPLQEEAKRFTNLVLDGNKDLLLEVLKEVEPDLKNLELLDFGGQTMIHATTKISRPIPLIFMGDGISRLATIVLALANAKHGVVLIDEIENGIHYSVLKNIWLGIGKACHEFNTQIFATTHSLECIRAAHKAFEESSTYDFRYHRLDRTKNGEIRVVSYDEEVMEAAIEADSEVR